MREKEKMTKKIIAFTSVGRRVELLQAFREAAEEIGIDLYIIGIDYAENAPALFFCDKTYKICKISSENYIPDLLDICRKESVDMIIPTIDTDLLILAMNKSKFKEIGTIALVSDADKIHMCRDKRLTAEFFENCDVNTPVPTDKVECYEGDFPCFIKPRDGSSSVNAYKINTKEELFEFSQIVPNYIIQPYIDGDEYTVDVLCDLGGNPVIISPRVRLAMRSGEVVKTRIIIDKIVEAECLRLVKEFRACGPLTIQFIKESKSGQNFYIEINPRFGGGAPLTMKAGANMAKYLLLMLLGHTMNYLPNLAREGEEYSRFDQSVCVAEGINNGRIDNTVYNIKDVALLCDKYDAVIFDLDDTLYSEKEYVRSGYRKISEEFPEIEDAYDQLWSFFEDGKKAIDYFLHVNNIDEHSKREHCLAVYRNQQPHIKVYDGVYELLTELKKKGKKIGIITDGRVLGQKKKIEALHLEKYVDEIIITDELAGNGLPEKFRKPNPISYQIMKERLNVTYDKMVYIGDNVQKDFKAPKRIGMGTIWFRNEDGIYCK